MMHALKHCRLFAYTVFVEAITLNIILSCGLIFMVGAGIALFVGEIAIVETRETQVGMSAAFLRLALLFFLALFTINSINREQNDRLLLLYLSLPVSRQVFVLGKFCGFALMAAILAVLSFGFLLLFTDAHSALLWSVSLLFEAWIVIGFSLLCAFSLGQITPAFAAVSGIYLLSRSLPSIILMSSNPLRSHEETVIDRFMQSILHLLDYLLPRLDRFTRSEWLMYGELSTSELWFITQQSIIYLMLLLCTACVDVYRKNI